MVFNFAFRDVLPTPGTDEFFAYERIQKLSDALEENGYKILIPTIVLSEAACIFDEAGQNRFFSRLPQSLIRADFTETTSRILARILYDRNIKTNKAHTSQGITNTKMKYDALILAMAVENGCDCLYTMDSDFSKYITPFISIKQIHEPPPGYPMGSLFPPAT